jgi:ATP-dependent Clp protease protease subunit
MCASAASIVFLAGDKRIAGCPIMIHNPWRSVDGNAKELREASEQIAESEKELEKWYSEKTGLDAKTISSLMDFETYMSPSQAVELGFATESKQSAMALINISNLKTKKMADKKKKGILAQFKDFLNGIPDDELEPQVETPPVNMILLTEAGEELTIDREEGEPEVGDTASPDGTHVMPDGSTIVIADGIITEITPAEVVDDELAQAKTEIEDLKAQLEKAKANARTPEDLKALNAIKMGGGYEKVFKGVKSTYNPPVRTTVKNVVEEGLGGKGGDRLAELKAKRGGQ